MAIQFQFRADTLANWTSANPILAANELVRESDTGKWKMGNGTTAYLSLPYYEFPSAGGGTEDLSTLVMDTANSGWLDKIVISGSGNALADGEYTYVAEGNAYATPAWVNVNGYAIADAAGPAYIWDEMGTALFGTVNSNLFMFMYGDGIFATEWRELVEGAVVPGMVASLPAGAVWSDPKYYLTDANGDLFQMEDGHTTTFHMEFTCRTADNALSQTRLFFTLTKQYGVAAFVGYVGHLQWDIMGGAIATLAAATSNPNGWTALCDMFASGQGPGVFGAAEVQIVMRADGSFTPLFRGYTMGGMQSASPVTYAQARITRLSDLTEPSTILSDELAVTGVAEYVSWGRAAGIYTRGADINGHFAWYKSPTEIIYWGQCPMTDDDRWMIGDPLGSWFSGAACSNAFINALYPLGVDWVNLVFQVTGLTTSVPNFGVEGPLAFHCASGSMTGYFFKQPTRSDDKSTFSKSSDFFIKWIEADAIWSLYDFMPSLFYQSANLDPLLGWLIGAGEMGAEPVPTMTAMPPTLEVSGVGAGDPDTDGLYDIVPLQSNEVAPVWKHRTTNRWIRSDTAVWNIFDGVTSLYTGASVTPENMIPTAGVWTIAAGLGNAPTVSIPA